MISIYYDVVATHCSVVFTCLMNLEHGSLVQQGLNLMMILTCINSCFNYVKQCNHNYCKDKGTILFITMQKFLYTVYNAQNACDI